MFAAWGAMADSEVGSRLEATFVPSVKGPNIRMGLRARGAQPSGVIRQMGGTGAGFVHGSCAKGGKRWGVDLPARAGVPVQAARSYSWMRPPRMSRRMTLPPGAERAGRGIGGASPRPRCGRASL
jgi:hypothetical protein